MKLPFVVVLVGAALSASAGGARAQDAPTQRPRGVQEPLTRQEAPSDSSQEGTAEERAAIGAMDEFPAPLRHVAPVYPPAALAAHVQGTVLVEVSVRRDGSAAPPRVRRSVAGLDDAALAAVSSWTWRPGRHAGKAQDMVAVVPVRFLLPPDPQVDWQAERRVAMALEADGRSAEAFDRYALAVRAMPTGAPPESLDLLRRDVIRTRPRGPAREGVRGDEPPVEAWIQRAQGDSLAAIQTPDGQRAAAAAYGRALGWAPWQSDWYLALARVEGRLGRRAEAARSLELYLLGDVPASDRARYTDLIARLRAAPGH